MGGTEATTRTQSFLMGVMAYLDMMELDVEPHELLKNITEAPNENAKAQAMRHYQLAVTAGRNFAREFDYDLEAPLYGEANRTPIGRLLLRFTTFGQQKFGKDAGTIYNAYLSEKDVFSEGLWARTKDLSRMLGKSTTSPMKEVSNRDVAALRRFYIQGAMTVLFDILFVAPLIVKGIQTAFGEGKLGRAASWSVTAPLTGIGSGGRKMAGVTSDLVSLSTMLPLMALKYAMNGEDDEEEIEKDIRYYLRRTFVGVGTTYSIDHTLWLLAEIIENDPKKLTRRRKAVSSYYSPGALPQKAAESAIDAFTKDGGGGRW